MTNEQIEKKLKQLDRKICCALKAFPPDMTTAERDAIITPTEGYIIYNTDANELNYYNGTTWIVFGTLGGSGTINYIPKWSDPLLLTNSQLYDDGTSVGVGTASPSSLFRMDVNGKIHLNDRLYIGPLPENYSPAKINISSFDVKTAFVNSVFSLSSTETGPSPYPTQLIFAQEGATVGWSIQSVNQGVSFSPLILNPNAPTAPVLIGTKTSNGELLQIAGNTVPSTNDSYTLGTTSYKWRDIYINRVGNFGAAGTTLGQIKLSGNTSGTVTLQTQAAAGTYNFNLPTTAGTAGYLFASGGGGANPITYVDPTTLSGLPLTGYTVATLPAGTQGDLAFVTDALAPNYLVAVVGGGAVVTPVFYDGTNWVAH